MTEGLVETEKMRGKGEETKTPRGWSRRMDEGERDRRDENCGRTEGKKILAEGKTKGGERRSKMEEEL